MATKAPQDKILRSIAERTEKIRALVRQRPIRPYEAVLVWKTTIAAQQRYVAGDIAELVELRLPDDLQRALIEQLAIELDADVFPDGLPEDCRGEYERGAHELVERHESDTIETNRLTVEFLRAIVLARSERAASRARPA
ncbi:MAG: hypothetical protein Q7R80_02400 [bacterium]|nr:hypothetical protein [bacterium]